jgi:adenylate cyclase
LTRAEQALSLNPNCALAYRIKGACQVCSPAIRVEGCRALLTSLRLNPDDPRNWWTWSNLSVGRYLLGDYVGAVDAAKRATGAHPTGIGTWRWLVAALGQLDRTDEARVAMNQAATALAPISFDDYACRRLPWMQKEDHTQMLDGLRKAGWEPT